jgi:hypothetical protein
MFRPVINHHIQNVLKNTLTGVEADFQTREHKCIRNEKCIKNGSTNAERLNFAP